MSSVARINDIYQSYQNKAYIEAELEIRKLLVQEPKNSDALRLGALTALALNQVMTAQTRLNHASQYCDLTAEMANTSGNIQKALGEWARAEAAYKQAAALDPDYKPVRDNLVDLLVQSGQVDRALTEINTQLRDYGQTDFLRVAKAISLTELGRYDEALDMAGTITEAYEAEKITHLKTRLLFHLGKYDEMKDMAALLPAGSDYAAQALETVSNAYAMTNAWDAFHDVIQSATAKAEAGPLIYVKAIHHLKRAGFDEQAQEIKAIARTRFEEDVTLITQDAHDLMLQGDYAGAVKSFQRALSLRPGDLSIMLNYAQACLPAKDHITCQNLIHGAMQQAPNNQFLWALGATLMRARADDYKALYDYDNFVRVYDLKPPKDYAAIEHFNQDLKTCLEGYHLFKSAPLNQSLRGGTQTDVDLFHREDPVLKAFFQMIDDPIRDYMKHIGRDAAHPLTRRNTEAYRIKGAWSVNLAPNGHHVNHVHPMGWISSSYYVDVPDSIDRSDQHEGWIKFGQPGIKGVNLPPEKFVKPQSGRLVLFPSYMWHGTVPFSGDQTRLTLPFDVVPA